MSIDRNLELALRKYITHIKACTKKSSKRTQKELNEFNASLYYKVGRKYIKVIVLGKIHSFVAHTRVRARGNIGRTERGYRSPWLIQPGTILGCVCNKPNKAYSKGNILKGKYPSH